MSMWQRWHVHPCRQARSGLLLRMPVLYWHCSPLALHLLSYTYLPVTPPERYAIDIATALAPSQLKHCTKFCAHLQLRLPRGSATPEQKLGPACCTSLSPVDASHAAVETCTTYRKAKCFIQSLMNESWRGLGGEPFELNQS